MKFEDNLMRATVGLLCVLSALAACGSHSDEPKQADPPPMKVEDSVFSGYQQSMDKARGVEGTLQQNKQQMDRAIDQDGG